MATQDVRFIMAVEDQGLIRKLTEAEQALYNLQGTSRKTHSEFDRLWKGFAVGNIAVSALHKGFAALKGFVEDSISEAIESEQAQHRLTTAMQMTGRAAWNATEDMIAFSKQQQALTIYTDEQVQATMTLLAQLTKLDAEGIKKATKGAMGLAAVLDMDLQSAALMVTKAMEGNTQALARVGIRIDENIPKEQQAAAVLEKLIALYPRATAELETMGGQLKNVKNLWGEVKESFGKTLTEALNLSDILPVLRDILKSTSEGAAKGKRDWRDYNMEMAGARGWIAPTTYALYEAEKAEKANAAAFGAFTLSLRTAKQELTPLPTIIDKTIIGPLSESLRILEIWKRNRALLAPEPFKLLETELPPPQKNIYESWLDTQRAFAREATKEVKDFYEGSHDYSAEFYQDITRGFTSAFMQFRISVQGFKDFFIGVWQSIKQAFFQILSDMLARWLVMSFVKGLFSFIFPGSSFFSPGTAGSVGFQHGFQGVITKPTLALIGEAGPEEVNIRPLNKPARGGGSGTTNIHFNFYSTVSDQASISRFLRHDAYPTLREMFAHGDL